MISAFEQYFSAMKGKRVAVLGLGVSNRPLVRLLLEYGAIVDGGDRTPREKLDAEVLELEKMGCKQHLGEDFYKDMTAEVAFRTALKQVTHLPELPPLPICSDELTHAALSLSIPDQCRYKAEWSQKLDQAKRCLIQLWNKPRNPEVVTAAMELCNSAYSAISSESWNTLNEILPLLSFFSQQLCAPRERNEALDKLLGYGRMMITLCEDLQSRGTFSAPEGFDELAFMGIDEGDKKSLELLRTLVRNGIRNFNRQDLSMPALIHCMEEDFAIYQKEIKQSQEFNQNLRDRIHRHQEQPLYSPLNDDDPDGEDLSGLSISPDPIRPDNPPPTGGSAIHIEYPEPESPVEPADPPRQNRDCDAAIDPDDYLDQHFFHKQIFYEERPADDLFG